MQLQLLRRPAMVKANMATAANAIYILANPYVPSPAALFCILLNSLRPAPSATTSVIPDCWPILFCAPIPSHRRPLPLFTLVPLDSVFLFCTSFLPPLLLFHDHHCFFVVVIVSSHRQLQRPPLPPLCVLVFFFPLFFF